MIIHVKGPNQIHTFMLMYSAPGSIEVLGPWKLVMSPKTFKCQNEILKRAVKVKNNNLLKNMDVSLYSWSTIHDFKAI